MTTADDQSMETLAKMMQARREARGPQAFGLSFSGPIPLYAMLLQVSDLHKSRFA